MRAVGIIVEIEVARPHVVARITLEDAVDEVAGRHRQRGRDDQPPVAIEEGGEIILLLADEGAHGAALDQRLHFDARRLDGALDQFQRDGVEIAHASAQPDDQVAVAVDLGGLAGKDKARRVELIDDGGAADPMAGAQRIAPVGRNVGMRSAVEP